jgi:hypothetical protein
MVCGKKVYQKVLAYVNIQMVVHMMVNGKKANHMEWVKKLYLMAQHLTEDGSKEKLEVMASKFYQMELYLKENGKRVDFYLANANFLMDKYMMVSGMKVNQKVLESKFGLMEEDMKEIGIRVSQLEKVLKLIKMEQQNVENGKVEYLLYSMNFPLDLMSTYKMQQNL